MHVDRCQSAKCHWRSFPHAQFNRCISDHILVNRSGVYIQGTPIVGPPPTHSTTTYICVQIPVAGLVVYVFAMMLILQFAGMSLGLLIST